MMTYQTEFAAALMAPFHRAFLYVFRSSAAESLSTNQYPAD